VALGRTRPPEKRFPVVATLTDCVPRVTEINWGEPLKNCGWKWRHVSDEPMGDKRRGEWKAKRRTGAELAGHSCGTQ
jgi:hypothetical protein